MLKNFVSVICILSVMFAAGCQPTPNDGNTARGNDNKTIGPNTNGNDGIAGNTNSGTVSKDKDRKSVQIAIQEINGVRKIAVAPELIQVPRNGKLRFTAYNNLAQEIVKVELAFDSDNPFDGGFEIGSIAAGDQAESKVRGVRAGVKEGVPYKYTVKVYVQGVANPIVLDPQVEIVGARVSNADSNSN